MTTPKNRQQRRATAKAEPKAPANLGAGHPDLPREVVLNGTRGPLKTALVVPGSLGLRYEVTYAAGQSAPSAWAAALALCSPAIRKHIPYRFQGIGQYGVQVTDWLLEEGVPYLQIQEAGRLAWVHVSHGLLDAKEVDETEGFTEATSDDSTS